MTFNEWTPRYRRLVKAFNKTESGEQCAAYFEALERFSDGVIEHAIAKVIAEEKYWPSAAELLERAKSHVASHVYTPPTCWRCHGDGFIDAPDQQHFNRAYTNYVQPCPDCHVPIGGGAA